MYQFVILANLDDYVIEKVDVKATILEQKRYRPPFQQRDPVGVLDLSAL